MMKDGDETSSDCGGACVTQKACPDGKTCTTTADCTGGAACNARNLRCPDGMGCGTGADCTSLVCASSLCQMPSCTDTVKNGMETDLNCGGTCTQKCGTGQGCLVPGDCQNGVCPAASHQCAAPMCGDGVKNGTETDLDCGGSCTMHCATGQGCVVNNDCVSGSCMAMKCAANGCVGGACWHVQYRSDNANTNELAQSFNIRSVGSTSTALMALKIRFWFTADGKTYHLPPECFFADPGAGACGNLTMQIVTLATPLTKADRYFEIGFMSGTLAAGSSTGQMQTRIHPEDWSTIDKTNDHSVDPTKTAFADWDHVTLYQNGVLVWGVEPAAVAQ